ncbi:MAG: MarR family winged helix-turn-helix transcriptional regulator [Rubricoccaceae bacterium]
MPTPANPVPSILDSSGRHTDPDAKITAALDRLGFVLRSLLASEAREAVDGAVLSPLQAQALVFVQAHAQTRVTTLAHEFEVSVATVSDAVRTLVSKGLLTKSPLPEDRRVVVLKLTETGTRAADRLAGWTDVVRQHVAEASPEDRAVVLEFLLGLIGRLAQAGTMSAVRACTTCRYLGREPTVEGGVAYTCKLAGIALAAQDLRLDCPEHEALVR